MEEQEINEVEINEVEVNDVEQDVKEQETKTEEKVIERPWKEKEPAIPYERFRAVNEEKKLYRERVEAMERELESYKKSIEPKEPESPDDLDPNKYNTVLEYIKAREELIEKRASKSVMDRLEATQRQRESAEYTERIVSNFSKTVETSVAENEEIPEAVKYLDSIADRIPKEVRLALLTDENAGHLCFEIATNPDLLKTVVSGDVVAAIRSMSKWSATFNKPTAKIERAESVEDIKTMIPKTVKGVAPAARKDPSKMSQSEYRKWRSGGGGK